MWLGTMSAAMRMPRAQARAGGPRRRARRRARRRSGTRRSRRRTRPRPVPAAALDLRRGAAALPQPDQPQAGHADAGQAVELLVGHVGEGRHGPLEATRELLEPDVGRLGHEHDAGIQSLSLREPDGVGVEAAIVRRLDHERAAEVRARRRSSSARASSARTSRARSMRRTSAGSLATSSVQCSRTQRSCAASDPGARSIGSRNRAGSGSVRLVGGALALAGGGGSAARRRAPPPGACSRTGVGDLPPSPPPRAAELALRRLEDRLVRRRSRSGRSSTSSRTPVAAGSSFSAARTSTSASSSGPGRADAPAAGQPPARGGRWRRGTAPARP